MTAEAMLFENALYIFMSVLFGIAALVFLVRLFFAMAAGDDVRIDYHWGGLGGGLGGWRISQPLVCLVAALGFGALLVATTIQMQSLRQSQAQKTSEQKAAADQKGAEQKAAPPAAAPPKPEDKANKE